MLKWAETSDPWCIIGDFNVIASTQEKLGGRAYNISKSLEFISIIEACGLVDMGYTGQDYTWCNHRKDGARIWKRLDRGMVNDKWLDMMPQSNITHLPSVGSDHCPLLLEMNNIQTPVIKYFRFLNCWTDNETFLQTIENCWNRQVIGDPMWIFHTKLKRLTRTLRIWSRKEYGDVFEKVKKYEEMVQKAEADMLVDNSSENREKLSGANAQYIKYLKLEYAILQQKTQLQWLKEGDANSKYFHAVIRGRRKKMVISKVMNEKGDWIQGEENIGNIACEYYQSIFTGKEERINEELIQCIPELISIDQKEILDRLPIEDEVRMIIMSMNPNSAPGPDGIRGKFYQVCFDIIKDDLMAVVLSFFNGKVMPRYMTHACLVLLPKVDHPNQHKDYRPISLSNFTNKIISKILSTRLASILPHIVSMNQSCFVRGRSISENIMLAQEIIHGIKAPKEGRNLVIKLDMVKAYDRVSWAYTCLILRKMGFSEIFIDRIWRIMSNNWYSIVINGRRYGFFHSTRGLKQGDPLSPALFILGAEVFSKHLNFLYQNHLYIGFNMNKKGPQVNHLSFADDIIIFTSTDNTSLQLIMKVIEDYEAVSDQKVNKEKSYFMVTPKTSNGIIDNIKRITGFSMKNSPINYLGCPLYIGGQRIIYFSEVVDKVIKKISGWQSKILNFGGKITLIKHVLQSIPIHTLAAISPPKTTINHIKKLMADFFWGIDKEGKKYHWASWDTMAYPTNEGGIGVRLLDDICKAFQYKHWWDFRTKNSLWSNFLKSKYCQRAHPVAKKYNTGDSLMWRYLTRNRIEVEVHIRWHIQSGTSSLWWDNWTGNGAIANYCDHVSSLNNMVLAECLTNGKWNERFIRQHVPAILIPHILQTCINYKEGAEDTAIWLPEESGKFSIASAWDIIRRKKSTDYINTIIWHKYIPFKISFFIWRAIRGKLPTNDSLQIFGKPAEECYCCYKQGKDDINHILSTGHFANYIWKYYARKLGVIHLQTNIRSLFILWRNQHATNQVLKTLFQILPNIICWNLWKNRCAVKYGNKRSSINRVQYGIYKDVMQIIKVMFPIIPWQSSLDELINIAEKCHQQYKIIVVN